MTDDAQGAIRGRSEGTPFCAGGSLHDNVGGLLMQVSMQQMIKRFDGQTAVAGVSLEIKAGELFTLLGPSGCGKTTLLRMVAGFYRQDEGDLRFGERLMNDVPPHLRNTGMVFQNYAVFPHLTVMENVAYGLRARKVPRDELTRRVNEALDMVKLGAYRDRQPSQLSGGQQQRVALARALVIQPDVLLMDEPLSNLDAKLRVEMRSEIRRLQREAGITTIYVTHDQEEALAISDRIAVMNAGRVEQVGTPREIYAQPRTAFVAGFIGKTNFLPGEMRDGEVVVAGQRLAWPAAHSGTCTVAVRPEAIGLGPGEVTMRGRVIESTFLGTYTAVTVTVAGDTTVEVHVPPHADPPAVGAEVQLGFAQAAAKVYDASGEDVA